MLTAAELSKDILLPKSNLKKKNQPKSHVIKDILILKNKQRNMKGQYGME